MIQLGWMQGFVSIMSFQPLRGKEPSTCLSIKLAPKLVVIHPQSVFLRPLNSLSYPATCFPALGDQMRCAIWLRVIREVKPAQTASWAERYSPHGGEMWMWMFSNSGRQDEITDLGCRTPSGTVTGRGNRRLAANFAVAGRLWVITERRGRRNTQRRLALTLRPEQPLYLQRALTLSGLYCYFLICFRRHMVTSSG